jgi:hypothetical protein
MSGGRALQAGDWIASYRIEAISGRAGLGRPELIQALEAVLAQPKVEAALLRRPAHGLSSASPRRPNALPTYNSRHGTLTESCGGA